MQCVPMKPRERRVANGRKCVMAVAIDKYGIVHIATSKREALKKAQEANVAYK